jgi:hypothetical protein
VQAAPGTCEGSVVGTGDDLDSPLRLTEEEDKEAEEALRAELSGATVIRS